jgi:hypothetical protein
MDGIAFNPLGSKVTNINKERFASDNNLSIIMIILAFSIQQVYMKILVVIAID